VKPYSVSLSDCIIVLVSFRYVSRGSAAEVVVGVCLCEKTLFYQQLQDYAVLFV